MYLLVIDPEALVAIAKSSIITHSPIFAHLPIIAHHGLVRHVAGVTGIVRAGEGHFLLASLRRCTQC